MADITSGQDVDILSWIGSVAPTVGQKTMANSIPIVISSDQSALTVSSHAVTNAGTFAVQAAQAGTWTINAVTSISSTVTTTNRTCSTATLSNVSGSVTSVTVLALNANRQMATVVNDSTSTLYLKFGSTASTTSYTVAIAGSGYYELPSPVYTGILTGIWVAAVGAARVTEITV